jgi:hypothetical protein
LPGLRGRRSDLQLGGIEDPRGGECRKQEDEVWSKV